QPVSIHLALPSVPTRRSSDLMFSNFLVGCKEPLLSMGFLFLSRHQYTNRITAKAYCIHQYLFKFFILNKRNIFSKRDIYKLLFVKHHHGKLKASHVKISYAVF